MKRLKELAAYPFLELGKHYLLEEIQSLRCKAVATAEKKCHKLRMGQVALSPQIQKAHRTIKAWSLLLKKATRLRISSRLLTRSLHKASLSPNARRLPIDAISQNVKEAYQEYYQIKGSYPELRATALENLAKALVEAGNTKKEKILTVLRHRAKK